MALAGPLSTRSLLPLFFVAVLCYATPAAAFGAGNIASISKIEGSNWRHGDIEDTLLSLMMAAALSGGRRKKFDAMTVKRVYFGNWLRDYSQAIDTGALKNVDAPTVRILLWVLSFMTFGLATGEFEVTERRLGCYRPEEHIDNPKDYNENEDARRYHPGLRGLADEETELGIDQETGLKNYIANERIRRISSGDPMATSAGLVRRLFTETINLGRKYGREGRKEDLYEALRLLGTGLHCLEDYSAHSNYTELALIELGENDVFPHVGRNTEVDVHGRRIWPLITGTFGGVDFLHSVMGEVSDKAIQSEVQQLEASIVDAQNQQQNSNQGSVLKDLLGQLNIGGNKNNIENKANELETKSAEQQKRDEQGQTWGIGGDPEQYVRELRPFLEFHDEIMKLINEALETIGLSSLVENLAEAASLFVFSLIAPYILPLLQQAREELEVGSSSIIDSSKNAQHVVFHDDYSSNPTHSMLSKDHFSNILNEPAGKIASAVVRNVVPLIMDAIDDTSKDVNRLCDVIIGGVFHHPAFRDGEDNRPGRGIRQAMFRVVEEWWESKDERAKRHLRQALSREGIQSGKNHEGHDTGHGCGKPLQRNKGFGSGRGNQTVASKVGEEVGSKVGAAIEQAVGGNQGGSEGGSGIGGMLGSLAGAALGAAFGNDDNDKKEGGSGGGGGQHGSGSYEGRQSSGHDRQESSRYERKEQTSYGSSGYSGRESSGYDDNSSSYGHRESSGHGRQETLAYGQSRPSQQSSYYGRSDNNSGHGYSGSRRRDDTSGGNSYGSSRRDDTYGGDSYGSSRRDDTYGGDSYGSSRRDDTYGGDSHGSSRRDDAYGGDNYGSSRRDDAYGGDSYGSSRRDDTYGGDSYGSSRRDDTYGGDSYGSSRRDDDYKKSSYDSGGHGSRRDDDDDNDNYKKKKHHSKHHDDDDDDYKKKKHHSKRHDDDDDDYKKSSYGGYSGPSGDYRSSRHGDDNDYKKKKKYGRADDDDDDKYSSKHSQHHKESDSGDDNDYYKKKKREKKHTDDDDSGDHGY